MAIEIRTDHFEFDQGRTPRGYGSWAFAESPRESEPDKIMWYTGKWSDARKSAVAWCRVKQIDQLYLLP